MSEKGVLGQEMLLFPFAVGKAVVDLSLMASLSLARMLQITMQASESALTKYIELTEQELKKGQRRESIKVG